MAKIPDFGGLTKKLDIQGLMDTVKSAVSGTGGAPQKAPEGDEVAARFVEVLNQVQELANAHSEQAKTISAIHSKLNVLYKDVQALRTTSATATTTVTTSTTATPSTTATSSTTIDDTEKPV